MKIFVHDVLHVYSNLPFYDVRRASLFVFQTGVSLLRWFFFSLFLTFVERRRLCSRQEYHSYDGFFLPFSDVRRASAFVSIQHRSSTPAWVIPSDLPFF